MLPLKDHVDVCEQNKTFIELILSGFKLGERLLQEGFNYYNYSKIIASIADIFRQDKELSTEWYELLDAKKWIW